MRGERQKRRYLHRLVPGWENESKCPGFHSITIEGMYFAVRCDDPHERQRITCQADDESGMRVEYDILEAHPHGATMYVPAFLNLGSERDCRARRTPKKPAAISIDDPTPF